MLRCGGEKAHGGCVGSDYEPGDMEQCKDTGERSDDGAKGSSRLVLKNSCTPLDEEELGQWWRNHFLPLVTSWGCSHMAVDALSRLCTPDFRPVK